MKVAIELKAWRRALVMINRIGIAAAILATNSVLLSCTQPGGPPPSAAKPVTASVAGLLKFFQEECVEQRDRKWVRQESQRKRDTCDSWLAGEGERGDCEMNKDGVVDWQVPTTAGSSLVVQMSWDFARPDQKLGPPEGYLNCSIAAPNALGVVLQKVAPLIVLRDHPLVGPLSGDGAREDGLDLYLMWKPAGMTRTTPMIELKHYVSMKDYKARLKSRGPINFNAVEMLIAMYEERASRPWMLQYTP
jgi:hypothetical protein